MERGKEFVQEKGIKRPSNEVTDYSSCGKTAKRKLINNRKNSKGAKNEKKWKRNKNK